MRRLLTAAPLSLLPLLAACGAGEETPAVEPQPVEVEVIEAPRTVEGLLPPAEGPDAWRLDREASSVIFNARQGDEAFAGRFGAFDAQIRLDPDDPSTAAIVAVVDLGSVDAGSSDRNESLPEAEWFDVNRHPRAEFRSDEVRRTGDLYEAVGTLRLKGTTQPVTLSFTLDERGDRAVADGEFAIDRTAFAVGEGEFGTEEFVDNDVSVVVHIEAVRAE